MGKKIEKIVKATKLFILVSNQDSCEAIKNMGFTLVTTLNEKSGTKWVFENKDMPVSIFDKIVELEYVAFTDRMYFTKMPK